MGRPYSRPSVSACSLIPVLGSLGAYVGRCPMTSAESPVIALVRVIVLALC